MTAQPSSANGSAPSGGCSAATRASATPVFSSAVGHAAP